ncbi:hypothetical protein MYK68_18450 [Gordonia sp. PP30]|uniref:hypothetical protein n=1 Tax=Gordonia sp. PP30 TaxID=2935861 RepID=UPI001FFFCA64|nr:hypothetical protein [Gordonia sp. PP30]UQE74666.1 hypothetical protein MYK68_18450 [Gordonia sp. PP30]
MIPSVLSTRAAVCPPASPPRSLTTSRIARTAAAAPGDSGSTDRSTRIQLAPSGAVNTIASNGLGGAVVAGPRDAGAVVVVPPAQCTARTSSTRASRSATAPSVAGSGVSGKAMFTAFRLSSGNSPASCSVPARARSPEGSSR